MTRGARRVRRYQLLGLLAWRGARRVHRHRYLGLLAWRGWRLYARRRRIAVRLAFGAAVALVGLLVAARRSRRPALDQTAMESEPLAAGARTPRLTGGSP